MAVASFGWWQGGNLTLSDFITAVKKKKKWSIFFKYFEEILYYVIKNYCLDDKLKNVKKNILNKLYYILFNSKSISTYN